MPDRGPIIVAWNNWDSALLYILAGVAAAFLLRQVHLRGRRPGIDPAPDFVRTYLETN